MTQASSDPQPAVASDRRERRRLGPLPLWLWVLIAILVLLILVGILLFGGGAAKSPDASPSATSPSASATPTPTASVSPSATPIAGSDVGQGTFVSEMDGYMSDVLFSQNTAVLSQGGTFSDPIFVVAADGSLNQNMTPDEAVNAMDAMFTPVDPEPWDLALPESTLEEYRAGPFGDYFPVGAIVARSYDGHVFSFIGTGSTITTMLMAASEDQLR
jgi:hypothetical protein